MMTLQAQDNYERERQMRLEAHERNKELIGMILQVR